LGLIESVSEVGVEGSGSREEVEDRGTSFGRESAIGMLTCHRKRWMSSLLVAFLEIAAKSPDDDDGDDTKNVGILPRVTDTFPDESP